MSGRGAEFTGGAFGRDAKVAVATAELVRLAGLFESVDAEVGASASAAVSLLVDLRMELIRCAAYAPLATYDLDMLLQGQAIGAWCRSVGFGTVSRLLRLAAAGYDDVDAAVRQTMNAATDVVDQAAVPLVVGGTAVAVVWDASPVGGKAGRSFGAVGSVDATNTVLDDLKAKGLDALNHTDPRMYEHLVNGAGWWVKGTQVGLFADPLLRKGQVNSSTALAAETLSYVYRGGDAHITSVTRMQDAAAPVTVAALVSTLSTRRRPARPAGTGRAAAPAPDGPEPPGRVDVLSRDVRGEDGRARRSHVVVLQGTSMWNKPLTGKTKDIRDSQANLQLRAGIPTAEMKAMPEALRRAGVRQGDDVHFVGFSQGGATAAALSGYPEITKRYNVRSIVTAGGPVGGIHIPDQVSAVHLQDHGDPVPALDGEAPSHRVNELTMGFTGDGESGPHRHDTGNYARGAALFDAAADSADAHDADDGARSAQAARQRLVEVGALAGPGQDATVQVTRVDLNRDM